MAVSFCDDVGAVGKIFGGFDGVGEEFAGFCGVDIGDDSISVITESLEYGGVVVGGASGKVTASGSGG